MGTPTNFTHWCVQNYSGITPNYSRITVGALTSERAAGTFKLAPRVLLAYVIVTLLCVAVAHVIHRVVEEPARIALRHWIKG